MPIADLVPREPLPADIRERRARRSRPWASVVIAASLVLLAYENGAYGIRERSIAASALWWTAFLGLALGLLALGKLTRASRVVLGLLAAFALWTLLSMLWAPSPELAFEQFDLNSLYVALFLVVALTAGLGSLRSWADGLRLGIYVVCALALISRLFPHVFASRDISSVLPNASTRLSFPIGYWNALAVLVSLAVPLSIDAACASVGRWRRAWSLATVPLIVSIDVLASSRGGILALLVGVCVFIAVAHDRWRVLAASVVAAVGSILAVVALETHSVLVDGPLATATAVHAGRTVAVALAAVATGTALLWLGLERVWNGHAVPSTRVGRSVLAALAVVFIAAFVAAHPIRRFDDFRRIPDSTASASFATAHLTSGSGSGRWQFWAAALDEWTSAPLLGRGAGSFRDWWSAHASFTYTLKNAHSLYLEELAELGIVGFALIVAAFAAGLVAGIRAAAHAVGDERRLIAALVAAFAAFAVCAGIDWLWQVPAVTAVGVASLALVTSVREPVRVRVRMLPGRSRLALGGVALLAIWAAIAAEAVPWLMQARVADSQSAAAAGRLDQALSDAKDARSIEPWAATPYLQLALVAEAGGNYRSAASWIRTAARRNSDDWATWYVASRIEREAGHPASSAAAYTRARSLNVKSPLFQQNRRP